MEFLRACLFALGIFFTLTVLALLVAGIMKIIYMIVHRTENKTGSETEAKPTATGKAG